MRIRDDTQNLGLRLHVIQFLVLAMVCGLAARLYYLQIVKGEFYAERAANQRIRTLPIPAPRGAILDRHGRVLADSRPIYDIILSREDSKSGDLSELIEPLAEGLDIDAEILRERFEDAKTQPAFYSIRIKENISPADIAWVEARTIEFPQLRVELQPQRRYPDNGNLAHVLGYVGEISSRQLELPEFKEKGYKPGDIIGREGLEAVYDEYLRGRDGYRTVLVDARGRIREVLEIVPPQQGQDLVTTIDLDLQEAAEEQLRNSPSQRGVIVALDPRNGEVLAMASYPTFDPNLFSQRITTREGRAEYARLLSDPQTPLYNRAIRGRTRPARRGRFRWR